MPTTPPETPVLDIDDARIRSIGLVILLITFVVFGLWAVLAPLGGAALAPGVVVVKSHRKTVQHLEGGIVERLLVREGDTVSRGDVLLELDDTQSGAELGIVNGQYIAARALEARLISERDGDIAVVYDQAWQQTQDAHIQEAVRGQNQIFLARKNAHDGERAVLEQRIGQLHTQEEGLTQLKNSKQALMSSYQAEIDDLKELLKDGFADKRRLREFERSYAQSNGDIADLSSRIAAITIKVGETQLQTLQVDKEFQQEVATGLGEVQSRNFELRERIQVLSDRVRRAKVLAPVDGMVVALAVHTEGGVVRPGSALMDIVPHKESLMVEAQVQPLDIDRVKPGLRAEVRFSAFARADTPVFEGEVLTLSGDRLIDEATGMPYYLARITLTSESKTSLDELEGIYLIPGMPAEVLIKTGDRTLFKYLAQPFSNMFARSFIED
ncbi:MAG: HlyD family type I secretion periplasmic adaptor subunit [Porticoccaceae bacterium]|nr:HlyD family type I secretion periplasmic adaptor subunit [Porticoccaceae bacterium]